MSQDGGARPKGKPPGSSEGHLGAQRKAKSSSRCSEGQSLSALGQARDGEPEGVEPPVGRIMSRSLRQKLQAAVGQCFPLQSAPHSPDLSSQRKIHLRELMLDTCPFPPDSGLARTWNILKQHTAPVSEQEALRGPLAACEENEDDPLRESHSRSIEQRVDFPSDPWIHGFGAGPLGKPRPKLDHGTDELVRLAEEEGQEDEEATASCPALPGVPRAHTQVDYIHCLVPDLLQLTQLPCYWGVMDRYQAEALLEGKAEGSFLLRDSAQEDYLFSVSFRRYGRSLHARIEQWNHQFSFDVHDPSVFHAPTVTGLLDHYKDPSVCMFFEPLLALPVNRTFPFGLQQLCRAVVGGRTTYDGIGRLPIPSALKEYLKEYHYKQRVRVRRLDTWWS